MSKNISSKRKLKRFQTYECNECEFEFVFPIPEKKIIEAHYNKVNIPSDIKSRIQNNINDLMNEKNNPKRDWFDNIFNLSGRFTGKKSLNILELGSAYGYFVHYANSNNHNAVGTEATSDYANASKGIINGEVKYIEDCNYSKVVNDKVDLVYMEHVFEHVLEPDKVLDGIISVLNNNGIVFISVPNSKGFLSLLLGKLWPWAVPPDHLYYYNKNALSKLLERKKLKVKQTWTGDYYFRSIPQFYSMVSIMNIFLSVVRKITGRKISMVNYSYKYPRNAKTILMLLPYWIFYPFIKIGSAILGYNELVVIASAE